MFITSHANGLIVFQSSLLKDQSPLKHAFSSRKGGVSPAPFESLNLGPDVGDDAENVPENRRRFLQILDAGVDRLAMGEQVHGNHVEIVSQPGLYPATDGLITARRGIVLAVKIADCVPLLFFDPVKTVLAVVHAGWRGVIYGIIPAAVQSMIDEFFVRPENLLCAIGPSIRSCCYEIQRDVADRFDDDAIIRRGGKLFLDLIHVIKKQLELLGLKSDNVDISEYCTHCQGELFFSYRRDGIHSGRMMLAAGLK